MKILLSLLLLTSLNVMAQDSDTEDASSNGQAMKANQQERVEMRKENRKGRKAMRAENRAEMKEKRQAKKAAKKAQKGKKK